nr:hypothetical protein [Tanacetum cinerariifolium]
MIGMEFACILMSPVLVDHHTTPQMVINSPCLIDKKEFAIPGKTTTSKESSNLLMVDSLPKTITATASTRNNGEIELTTTIDGHVKTITEAFVMRHLKLADANGISNMPNTKIFEQLALMGHGGNTTTVSGLDVGQDSGNIAKSPTMPHDLSLPRVNTLGSDEGKEVKSSRATTRSKVVISNEDSSDSDILDQEDPFKQRRKISKIDQDPDISLVQEHAEFQGRYQQEKEQEMKYDFDLEAERNTSIADVPVSTDGAGTLVKMRSEKSKNKSKVQGVVMTESSQLATRSQPRIDPKDKGKGIMKEQEKPKKIKDQVAFNEEVARKVEEEWKAKRTQDFVLMDTKKERKKLEDRSKKTESSKRVAKEELDQQSSKRQKTDGLSEEELQQIMVLVPKERMNVKALQTKYPIIDWEIYIEDLRKYWKIIRVGNHTKVSTVRCEENYF